MTTKVERIKTKVTALLGDPNSPLTHKQIAEIAGCSKKTVQRISQKIKPDLTEIEVKLGEYRRLLQEEMPIQYRAKRLKELATQDTQAMVALKALERADMLDGLSVVKDMPPPEPPRRPLFNLPEGARVAVTLDITTPEVIEAIAEEVGNDQGG